MAKVEWRYVADDVTCYTVRANLMFGSKPFREPRLVLIGAVVFAGLFEAVSVLVDFVATGRLGVTWNSLWFFCAAFFGYILVASLIRRSDARAASNVDRD